MIFVIIIEALTNAGVQNTVELFDALNEFVDAKLEILADDLRDRMDGRGEYDPDW